MHEEHQNQEMQPIPSHTDTPPQPKNNLLVPLAIVAAGALIAGAIYLSAGSGGNPSAIADNNAPGNVPSPQGDAGSLDRMAAVSGNDHVRGNPDAPVKIVEYSDTECPFCKRFHETMKQVMDEYGKEGKVAWVYRQFPLTQLHPKAPKESEATECAAELGGNDKFWAYLDRLFEVTPSNNNLDPMQLHAIAQYVGLDMEKFNTCLNSGKYANHIEEDSRNATDTGGNGTPWSIVVAKNGRKFPLSGAQPYDSVKQLIELALQEN